MTNENKWGKYILLFAIRQENFDAAERSTASAPVITGNKIFFFIILSFFPPLYFVPSIYHIPVSVLIIIRDAMQTLSTAGAAVHHVYNMLPCWFFFLYIYTLYWSYWTFQKLSREVLWLVWCVYIYWYDEWFRKQTNIRREPNNI